MNFVPPAREAAAQPVAPTGTVTLLFTDIEGSTARWEQHPRAMQAAVAMHDAIVRREVERRRGYVFKTVGDAFCVAFERPEDAIRAAVEVQQALAGADFGAVGSLRVRIAAHCGTTHERDGDYFGPSVNRVARLLSAGHGGQTLISGILAELVADRLPADVRLVDLGTHKLKDLDRAERIYQLESSAAAAAFPPLRTVNARKTNLPAALTSFVGREREVADLCALLSEHRTVTIVGSGGIGKTRTALQVAALQLERFAGGVWFVELAPLTDGALMANSIAGFVGVELPVGSDVIGSLVAALKSKKLLLILDNCEHLIGSVAGIVAVLLAQCPDVCTLATSRQILGIAGEHIYRMPTLSVPAQTTPALQAGAALEFEAIRLFVERARALDAAFDITDSTAPVIADICRRLDGIALAIELAAARVRVLAPAQLRDRLDQRFKLLTSSGREISPRQQTLRTLIDWSFDLLDPGEQRLFCRLGIFADGFALEAAAAVGGDETTDDLDMLDTITSLADKSLVVADVNSDFARYRLLESMRAYALMKLDESADRPAIAARHLDFYAAFAERAERDFDRDRNDAALFALRPELDNVRTALAWAFDGGDAAAGAKLLAASRQLWRLWSASAEGIDRCERAVASGAFDAATTARLLNVASFLAYKTGRTVAALECAERAVSAARGSGDAGIIFDAFLCRSLPLMFAGRVSEAETDLGAAENVLHRAPTAAEQVRLLEARGILKSWREEYTEAALAFEQLVQLHRARHNVEGAVQTSCNLAECEHARGQTERAIAVVRAHLRDAQTLGHYWHAYLLANLAGYLVSTSAMTEAHIAARTAIELSMTDPGAPLVANAMEHFALTLALDADAERAARLLGYCNATRAANGFRRQHTEQTTHDRLRLVLGQRYAARELDALLAQGAILSAAAAAQTALLARAPA